MNTELIEKYLLNLLNPEEKAAFEARMSSDNVLQEELAVQKQIMEAMDRLAIKSAIQKSMRSNMMKKTITKGSIILSVTAAAVMIGFFIFSGVNTGEKYLRYSTNELGTKDFADADKYLPSQLFSINPDEDTIVETTDGIIFAIPAHAFKNTDGTVAKGTVDIEVKEAFNTGEILKAGLNTESDGTLLETAGMFYFNARSGEKNLVLDKPVNANIPATDKKPAMKLYEGKRTADGSINWVNPVEIDKDLITYNIADLDFYPPDYIPALQKLGLNSTDKKYTDSLYYSFSGYQLIFAGSKLSPVTGDTIVEENTTTRNIYEKVTPYDDGNPTRYDSIRLTKTDSMVYNNNSVYIFPRRNRSAFGFNVTASLSDIDNTKYHKFKKTTYVKSDSTVGNYEIDPSRIKAIWNERFNNTILATKEFEERLKYIQSQCDFVESKNVDVFNIYVQNLDKPLYYSDSTIVSLIGPYASSTRFPEFYRRHDGGVKISSKMNEKLGYYFAKRSEALRQIAQKTWERILADDARKDYEAQQKENIHEYLENKRNGTVFIEEYEKNLEEAKLKYSKVAFITNYYTLTTRYVGWHNLDRAVYDATLSRTTLSYEDPVTGQKAEIKYTPITVKLDGNYDRTLVYLIPHELTSFQRMKQDGNTFTEKLNGFLKYDIVAIGYKSGKVFYHLEKDIQPGDYSYNLEVIDQKDLTAKLWSLGKDKKNDIRVDIGYEVFMQKEAERTAAKALADEQRRIIASSIFPCLPDSPLQGSGETMVNSDSTKALK
jgi:hypothetical protein